MGYLSRSGIQPRNKADKEDTGLSELMSPPQSPGGRHQPPPTSPIYLFWILAFFEAGSPCVAQVGLEVDRLVDPKC